MNDNDTGKLRTKRVSYWALAAACGVAAIAVAGLTAASMHTAAIEAEMANAQKARIEPVAATDGDTIPATLIKPSPVIESDPGFFVGAGDGGNGYYAERPANSETERR